MPSREKPLTPAGKALRRSPWLLAAIALFVLVVRIASGNAGGSWLLLAITAVVTVVVIVGWTWRLNRRARREGEELQAFACSTAPQVALLKRVPQFEQPLRRVKLGFLVGGWLLGRLFVGSDGISWVPNTWTRRILRAPRLHLDWPEIAEAAVVDQPGPGDPGIPDLRLSNGAVCAFMINRRRELAALLDELNSQRAAGIAEGVRDPASKP